MRDVSFQFKCSYWEEVEVPEKYQAEIAEAIMAGTITTSEDIYNYLSQNYGTCEGTFCGIIEGTSEPLSVEENQGCATVAIAGDNRFGDIWNNGEEDKEDNVELYKDFLTYQQTDGSFATLQYGRKESTTSWRYRQWLSKYEMLNGAPLLLKTAKWDSPHWEEHLVNLQDYTINEVSDHVSTYGYEVIGYSEDWSEFRMRQVGTDYSNEDSVQLACECIFENICTND